MQPMISILTMLTWNSQILDNLHIPEGLDKDSIQILITDECAELPLVVTNPKQFAILLDKWSTIKNKKWTKMLEAMQLEYNPLENYDRYEESFDTRTPNITNKHTDKNTGANTSKYYKNGYNSQSQVLSDTSVQDTNVETTDTQTGTDKNDHEAHIHGNIGVTTSQQMIQSELELSRFLVEEEIVSDFKDKFCVEVY